MRTTEIRMVNGSTFTTLTSSENVDSMMSAAREMKRPNIVVQDAMSKSKRWLYLNVDHIVYVATKEA